MLPSKEYASSHARAMAITKTLSQDVVEAGILERSKGRTKLIGKYVDCRIPVEVQCLVCEHKWKVSYGTTSGWRNGGCPACFSVANLLGQKTRLSSVILQEQLNDVHGYRRYAVTGEYGNWNTKIEVRCNKCYGLFSRLPRQLRSPSFNCPECSYSTPAAAYSGAFRWKNIKIHNREFRIQGHEDLAIDYIVTQIGIPASEIYAGCLKESGHSVRIAYKEEGKDRKYFPDIYIPEHNIVVEVKSLFTAGLHDGGFAWEQRDSRKIFLSLKRKRKAALAQGYEFKLLIFARGRKLPTLSGWESMSYSQLQTRLLKHV